MGHEGQAFITHEFNEAIAVQEAIVESGRQLSESVTVLDAQKSLKQGLKEDERLLKELQKLGEKFGDTDVRDKAGEFQKAMKDGSEELVKQLGQMAVQIATKDGAAASQSA